MLFSIERVKVRLWFIYTAYRVKRSIVAPSGGVTIEHTRQINNNTEVWWRLIFKENKKGAWTLKGS